MEVEKNKSKGSIIAIIVLIILVIALGSYIVYDKILSDPSSKTSNTNNNTTNINSDNLVSKLDNFKDWVYDAEYERNVSADSYTLGHTTFYAKDIVVPFINIDSSYADSSNNVIKKVFDDAIKEYNNGVNNKTTYIDECNYKKYVNNNALSVILTYGVGSTDVVHPQYYTYNIDLKSGNKLSYQEVYKIAGFDSDNIDSKVESAITTIMKAKLKDFEGINFDIYNNRSINNYKNSISNNTLKYFLSDNGKLNIVVKLIIPAGTEEFDTIITLDE